MKRHHSIIAMTITSGSFCTTHLTKRVSLVHWTHHKWHQHLITYFVVMLCKVFIAIITLGKKKLLYIVSLPIIHKKSSILHFSFTISVSKLKLKLLVSQLWQTPSKTEHVQPLNMHTFATNREVSWKNTCLMSKLQIPTATSLIIRTGKHVLTMVL